MLNSKRIVDNTKKYFETANKLEFMNDELMNFLGEDFIKAPASAYSKYNNAFEGGLIDHLLRVGSYAVKINNALPVEEKVDQTSLLKVCLLHQIGKAKLFTPCMSDWHKRNQGKMYEFNEELTSMRIGERSVLYVLSHGIKLSEEEYSAIIFFDRNDDKMVEYHNSMVGELLKMASVLAIRNERKNKSV